MEKTIRLEAVNEINMFASNINLHASKKINIKGEENVNVSSNKVGILGKDKSTIYGRNTSILGKQRIEIASPNIKYKQSGFSPPREEDIKSNNTIKSVSSNNLSNKPSRFFIEDQPTNNEDIDKNTTVDECVDYWKDAESELKRKIDNWLDELINITQDWSMDMIIEGDDGDQLSVTTYLSYLGKVLKLDPRLNVAISIGEKAYNYVSNKIAKSIEIDGKFKVMRLRGDIITGFELFKNDTQQHKNIFEFYKGYCMQQNISCKQAKDSISQIIIRLPNKWEWYESLCISWIKSSIDTPWWKELSNNTDAGIVIVKATFNPPYQGLAFQAINNDVHWQIETSFDNDVVKKKGLYKCLKHIYSKNCLNKYNLLRLPLPFTFILNVAKEMGQSRFDNQFTIIKRDDEGKWSNYDSKYILLNAFDTDIKNKEGVPVITLGSRKRIESIIK